MFVNLRNEKIEAMDMAYPSLHLVTGDCRNGLVWQGWLNPIKSIDDLDALLDDFENDRQIDIVGSEIVHHSKCEINHPRHRLREKIKHPLRAFNIRLVDFCSDRQPEATVINSPIPPDLWKHRSGEADVCAYAPWEYPWRSDKLTPEFVDQVIIWLFKQNIYSQTGEWLGSEKRHDSAFLLKTIKPNERCYCGSAKTYQDCHKIDNIFEVWRFLHRSNPNRFENVVKPIFWVPPVQTKKMAA